MSESRKKQEMKSLLTFIIVILTVTQSFFLLNVAKSFWGILVIPYLVALLYIDYHLAFAKYVPKDIIDHLALSALLTTMALVVNPLGAIGILMVRIVMIKIARLAIKRNKI